MTNVIRISDARARRAYRDIGAPIQENLRDPHAPMRGVLYGVGISLIGWYGLTKLMLWVMP